MRKKLAMFFAGFCLSGLMLAVFAWFLEAQYSAFRQGLEVVALEGNMPGEALFISPKEQEFLRNIALVETLQKTKVDLVSLLPASRARELFVATRDPMALRKHIREMQISGISWRAYAARGELLVLDLRLGDLVRAEEKELKFIWAHAANSYREARLRCEAVDNLLEYEQCVDTTTKSYEFLVRPKEQGGLGNLMTQDLPGEFGDTQIEIPLIKGFGAGGAYRDSYGRR